jgi:hypothetical protein
MSFKNYRLDDLKQILKDFREYHDIKYGHKMSKGNLINELEKNFEIEGVTYMRIRYKEAHNLVVMSKNSKHKRRLIYQK